MNEPAAIGVLDSGVGGLSILREIRRTLPGERLIYFADQAHVPYGERSLEEVRALVHAISRFLISCGSRSIVVACNTASAAALKTLRAEFPQIPFVGMEPALKPAARSTLSGVVGVLATPTTFQGRLYESVVERFGSDVRVLERSFPRLVERIEAGDVSGPHTRAILAEGLRPLVEAGADTFVLACTHFPFVLATIRDLLPSGAVVIDPSPAIAARTADLVSANRMATKGAGAKGRLEMYTTGNPEGLRKAARRWLGVDIEAAEAVWKPEFVLEVVIRRGKKSKGVRSSAGS